MKVRKITMKKTTKKLSLGMKIASILACLALVSVGFASWWIIQFPQAKTINEGSFEVYSVDTKEITFENPTFTDGAEIVYGYNNADPEYNWLGADKYSGTNTSGVKPEKLSATLQFKVKLDDANGNLDDYLSEIKVEFDAGTAYETAMSANANYGGVVAVGAPTVEYRITKEASFTNEQFASCGQTYTTANNLAFTFAPPADCGDELLVEVKFTFAWGSTTNGQNPYEFFNQSQYEEGTAITAENFLKAVYELNAQQAYKVTLSTTPGRPEATN